MPILLESSFGFKVLPGSEVVTLIDPTDPSAGFNGLDPDDPRFVASSGLTDGNIGNADIVDANMLNNILNKEVFRNKSEKVMTHQGP